MGRIIDVNQGKILVATDIHGNWEDYKRTREIYTLFKKKNKADMLVFAGDLVHGYGGYEDKSLNILDDLIDNKDSSIISLMGNHEFAHIYHMEISMNGRVFVESLEDKIEKLSEDKNQNMRKKYVGFMKDMPYAIRTKNGITINHAGANLPMAGFAKQSYKNQVLNSDSFDLMNRINYDSVLNQLKEMTRTIMEKNCGHKLADDFFDDYSPQIGQVFENFELKHYWWDVFFNMNEKEYGYPTYETMQTNFLKTMSRNYDEQKFIVSGHVHEPTGDLVIGGKQLRVTSSAHAQQDFKALALADTSKKYSDVLELANDVVHLYSNF